MCQEMCCFLLLQLNTLYIFPRKKISHKVNKRKKKSKTKKLNILKSLVVKFHMKIPMLSSVKVLVVSMFIKYGVETHIVAERFLCLF